MTWNSQDRSKELSAAINQAVALHQNGDLVAAAVRYAELLAEHPNDPDVIHLNGVMAKLQRQPERAIQLITRALQINPNGANSADYHNNLAEAYRACFQYAQASEHYQAALALLDEPTAAIMFNMGGCLQEVGQHKQAIRAFSAALSLQPNHARAHFRRAYSYLSTNQHDLGWMDFEWHHQALTGLGYPTDPRQPTRQLARPSTLGRAAFRGARVLVLEDQGLGDELCMLRLWPRLQALTASATYQANAKLAPLLQRSQLCHLWDQQRLDFDQVICTSELPYVTGLSNDAGIPQPVKLQPNPARVAVYQAQLEQLPRPWIGITWQAGTPENLQGQYKAVAPAELCAALEPHAGTLVTLQRHADLAMQPNLSHTPVADFNADIDDLENALALMALLDEYVGVSNTNVHLRAALDKSSHVLTTVAPIDYRWPASHNHSPWYTQCRAYRQSQDGTWHQALKELGEQIGR